MRDFIFFNEGIDLFLVITVVTQCIKNLCQSEMGKVNYNLLRGEIQPPVFYNCTNRGSRSLNNRSPPQKIALVSFSSPGAAKISL